MDIPIVQTLAGNTTPGFLDGFGTNAQFDYPFGVAISPDDSYLLITEIGNCQVRKIILSTVEVDTLAGGYGTSNGIGTNAQFLGPSGIDMVPDGTYALIVDSPAGLIRKLMLSTLEVTTLAGNITGNNVLDGFGTNAHFHNPYEIAISPDGTFSLVSELSRNMIRLINLTDVQVSTLAGNRDSDHIDGIGTNAYFSYPKGIAISSDNSYALVADSGNQVIRKIVILTAAVTTYPKPTYLASWSPPKGIDIFPSGEYALVTQDSYVSALTISTGIVSDYAGQGSYGYANGVGTNAQFIAPQDIMISSNEQYAIVADYSAHLIRRMDFSSPSGYPTLQPTILTTSTLKSSNDQVQNVAAIVGGVIGGLGGLLLITAFIYFFFNRSKATADSSSLNSKVEMNSRKEEYDQLATRY